MDNVQQISAFLADPENFLIGLDLQQGLFQFIRMPRQEISAKAFLDPRAIEPGHKKAVLAGNAVLQALRGKQPVQQNRKSNYLFHTSFCCSTLIARCLDKPGKNLSLKEPYALLGLSGFKRRSRNFNASGEGWKNWCDLTLQLLSRPCVGGEKVLLKPSNGANNILPEILRHSGTGRVVLLYSSLDYFLASEICGGQERVGYINSILPLFFRDFSAGLDLPDLHSLTSLQRAALVWGLQMKAFNAAAGEFPVKTRTLDCQIFLDHPLDILKRLADFYEIGFTVPELEAIASGPVMTKHAKKPDTAYSPREQNEKTLKVVRENQKQIKDTADWCKGLGLSFPAGLPNPL